jgi:hypothetical protein
MLALVLAALLPLHPSDQLPPPSASSPSPPGAVLPARSFSRIFTLQDEPSPPGGKTGIVLDGRPAKAQKKVVCGLTIIVVDGRMDPKMAIVPNGGVDIDPRMPRVPPPMCGEKKK